MTLNDLKEEVASLGFETELENSEGFTFALKRALRSLYAEYDVIGNERFYIERKNPSFHVERLEISSLNTEIELSGLCYSFTTVGTGSYTIRTAATSKTKSFNRDGEVHRGFIEGGHCVISFCTNYSATVYDLAVFEKSYGPALSDVPVYSQLTEYDLKEKIPKISSLLCPPKDDSGNIIAGISVSGTKLFIPRGFSGAVNVRYKRAAPDLPTLQSSEIDMPSECEHLLALLVAFYVWLDDDPEKANIYMSLFREGLMALKHYKRDSFDAGYSDVLGWA